MARLVTSVLGKQQKSLLHTLTSCIRPGSIYYHPHPNPQRPLRYAVSFLDHPSGYPDSATNLGYIPLLRTTPSAETNATSSTTTESSNSNSSKNNDVITATEQEEQSLLRKFEQNPEWMKFVHFVLEKNIQKSRWLQQLAQGRKHEGDFDEQGGYVHIIDERNIPPVNRAGDPDDIIASVLVKNGTVVPDTYEPSQTYRVYTRDGFMTLPKELNDALLQSLQVARQIEDENDHSFQ